MAERQVCWASQAWGKFSLSAMMGRLCHARSITGPWGAQVPLAFVLARVLSVGTSGCVTEPLSWMPRLAYPPVSLAWASSSYTILPSHTGLGGAPLWNSAHPAILSPAGAGRKSLMKAVERAQLGAVHQVSHTKGCRGGVHYNLSAWGEGDPWVLGAGCQEVWSKK